MSAIPSQASKLFPSYHMHIDGVLKRNNAHLDENCSIKLSHGKNIEHQVKTAEKSYKLTYYSLKPEEEEEENDDEEINLDMDDYGSKNKKFFQRAITAFCVDCRPYEVRGNKNNSYIILKNNLDNYTFNFDYLANRFSTNPLI